MTVPQFRILGPKGIPAVQRVTLALAPRGSDLEISTPPLPAGMQPTFFVVRHGNDTTALTDEIEMVEMIEALHPDQPFHPRDPDRLVSHRKLMAASLRAQGRLEALLSAQTTCDLDLAHHFLHEALLPLEHGLADRPLAARRTISNLDVMLAPLLWRMLLLDRFIGTHIASRLPRLHGWTMWLMQQDTVSAVLTDAAAHEFLDELRNESSAVICSPQIDWNRAFVSQQSE